MKNTSISMSLLVIGALSVNVVAHAKNKTPNLNERAVNAKCYVELVGGGETISLWSVKPSLLKKLKHNIIGQKIRVIGSKKPKAPSKNKAIIYKAKECILEEDEFSSPRARAMDKELPR
jgi:hypothetical protein